VTTNSGKQECQKAGSCPLTFQKGGNVVGGVFFITASWVISWCVKIELKQIYSFFIIFEDIIVVEKKEAHLVTIFLFFL